MTFVEMMLSISNDSPEDKQNTQVIVEIDDKYYEVTDVKKDVMTINGQKCPVLLLCESDFKKVEVS